MHPKSMHALWLLREFRKNTQHSVALLGKGLRDIGQGFADIESDFEGGANSHTLQAQFGLYEG